MHITNRNMNAHSTFTTIIIHICKQLFLKALPNNMSNSRGNTAKIMDFPYPVGNATNVSFPETKVLKASNYRGTVVWNSLSTTVTEAKSVHDFRLKFLAML